MKREEIISGLKFTIEMFLFDPSTGETITEPRNDMDRITIDACKGAIELLEQIPDLKEAYNKGYKDGQEAFAVHLGLCKEEKEPCGKDINVPATDAISRQAVLDMVEDMTDQFGNKHRVITEGMISLLPPITPKPKTGHWILQPSNKEQGERDFIWWKCSECGQVIYSETEQDRREYHEYCGRCGAKMSEIPTGSEKE